jgi:hypothetical protein
MSHVLERKAHTSASVVGLAVTPNPILSRFFIPDFGADYMTSTHGDDDDMRSDINPPGVSLVSLLTCGHHMHHCGHFTM